MVAGSASEKSWTKVSSTPPLKLAGSADLGGLVNLSVAHDGVTATITLAGPAGSWFGVGFDAAKMADAPYAIIVDGTGAVTERRLVEHGPGTLIAPSIKVVAAAVADGVQTVTVTPGGGRCLVVCAEAVLPQRLPRRGLVVYDALGFLVFLVEHFPMHLEIVWFVD